MGVSLSAPPAFSGDGGAARVETTPAATNAAAAADSWSFMASMPGREVDAGMAVDAPMSTSPSSSRCAERASALL